MLSKVSSITSKMIVDIFKGLDTARFKKPDIDLSLNRELMWYLVTRFDNITDIDKEEYDEEELTKVIKCLLLMTESYVLLSERQVNMRNFEYIIDKSSKSSEIRLYSLLRREASYEFSNPLEMFIAVLLYLEDKGYDGTASIVESSVSRLNDAVFNGDKYVDYFEEEYYKNIGSSLYIEMESNTSRPNRFKEHFPIEEGFEDSFDIFDDLLGISEDKEDDDSEDVREIDFNYGEYQDEINSYHNGFKNPEQSKFEPKIEPEVDLKVNRDYKTLDEKPTNFNPLSKAEMELELDSEGDILEINIKSLGFIGQESTMFICDSHEPEDIDISYISVQLNDKLFDTPNTLITSNIFIRGKREETKALLFDNRVYVTKLNLHTKVIKDKAEYLKMVSNKEMIDTLLDHMNHGKKYGANNTRICTARFKLETATTSKGKPDIKVDIFAEFFISSEKDTSKEFFDLNIMSSTTRGSTKKKEYLFSRE